METHFNGQSLGDFLRAAEADANRFHGAQATAPWRGGRNLRGSVLVAGATLLAVAAAMLLALGPEEPAAPRVTLAAARPAPVQWFAPPPAEVPADDEAPRPCAGRRAPRQGGRQASRAGGYRVAGHPRRRRRRHRRGDAGQRADGDRGTRSSHRADERADPAGRTGPRVIPQDRDHPVQAGTRSGANHRRCNTYPAMTSPLRTRPARPGAAATVAPVGRMHVVPSGFLYAGRFDDVTNQRQSAVLYLALNADAFEVQTADTRFATSALFVGPGVRKRIRAKDSPVVSIDISPTHRAFPTFARGHPAARAWPRAHFAALQDTLMAFREWRLAPAEADRLYEQAVDLAAARLPAAGPLDPRVREVMRRLRGQHGLSTQELAEAVNLSKDWLVHLFQREVGIPLRRYEQTLKLQAAAAYLRRGVSLTEVAAIAGFSDSSHFSKLWKQHFGFPPQRSFMGEELFVDPMSSLPCVRASTDGLDTLVPTG